MKKEKALKIGDKVVVTVNPKEVETTKNSFIKKGLKVRGAYYISPTKADIIIHLKEGQAKKFVGVCLGLI